MYMIMFYHLPCAMHNCASYTQEINKSIECLMIITAECTMFLGVLLHSFRSQSEFSHHINHRNSLTIASHRQHGVFVHYSE